MCIMGKLWVNERGCSWIKKRRVFLLKKLGCSCEKKTCGDLWKRCGALEMGGLGGWAEWGFQQASSRLLRSLIEADEKPHRGWWEVSCSGGWSGCGSQPASSRLMRNLVAAWRWLCGAQQDPLRGTSQAPKIESSFVIRLSNQAPSEIFPIEARGI